ncbi:hypothetical protein GCM10022631_24830 [Deinococcus rubellus]
MTGRRVYFAEFKRDAVQLARTSRNLSSPTNDLDINVSLPRKWTKVKQEKVSVWARHSVGPA